MKFNISQENLKLNTDDCIITGIFEESILFPTTQKINLISNKYIQSLINRNVLHGKIGEILLLCDIPNIINQKILIVGCGKNKKFDIHHYKIIIHKIIEYITNISVNKLLFFVSEFDIIDHNDYWKIRKTIEIFNDKIYVFKKFKNTNSLNYSFNEITLYVSKNNKLQNCKQAITDGVIISNNIKIAKDISNTPPNICTPIYLINQIKLLSNKFPNITIEILDALEMKKLGMNAYLSVGQGSLYPPIMGIIKYQGNKNNFNIQTPIVLIGKGVTFDSGGISIKPSDNMDEMKYDMCGAAVVYATIRTAIELNLPLNIIGILAVCENMISNTSLRPGDIITSLSGKTIEVLNTDAEGRLILCDVLTYVERYNPKFVINIATLTGACVIALGHHFTGLMSNNDELAKKLIFASTQTQDHVWQLPLNDLFNEQLMSTCADLKNIGGKDGSVITAGYFLSKFAYKYKWAHLDIAGTAWISNHHNKSATGRPVALLSQFLINNINNN